MRLVIVTGMSGAGKSTALRVLEDIGYFCVDNLPAMLVPKLGELLAGPNTTIQKIALGMDVRSGKSFQELNRSIGKLKEMEIPFEILFLDASDSVLIKRYKETRRSHPLAADGRIDQGIDQERRELDGLAAQADYTINTSRLLVRELKEELTRIFVEDKEYKNLYVTVLSFGFKYGIPSDADLIFDVRFLPNPYYVEELRPMTGNDRDVREYVMQNEKAGIFMDKLTDLISFLIPNYISEGKTQLVIGIGCTGGKHRSVTLANALYEELSRESVYYGIKIEHRDIGRDAAERAK